MGRPFTEAFRGAMECRKGYSEEQEEAEKAPQKEDEEESDGDVGRNGEGDEWGEELREELSQGSGESVSNLASLGRWLFEASVVAVCYCRKGVWWSLWSSL